MSLVSVIIPTHQRPQLFAQAVASVLAQSYPKLEVIVIEDGATDETAAVLESFHDLRLRYFWQKHSGRSAARNHGLRQAKGEFIAFLDDDDLYLPDKVACEVAFLESHPDIDLVGTGVQILDLDGSLRTVWKPWLIYPILDLSACLRGCPFLTCGVLIRRMALDRLDHWFDADLDQAEEADFFIRLVLAGCRMDWLPETFSVYRQHSGRSPAILFEHSRSYRQMLDKLYNHPDMPDVARSSRARTYLHFHMFSSARFYACSWVSAAQRELFQAALTEPQEDIFASEFIQTFAFVAANKVWVKEPAAYLDFVFNYLPSPLNELTQLRQKVFDQVSSKEYA